MCVILDKAVGTKLTADALAALVKEGWMANPHGAGFVRVRDDKAAWAKGFMDAPALLAAIGKVAKDERLIVHLRYKTHGGAVPELTHPFLIATGKDHKAEDGELRRGESLLIHNGSIGISVADGESDTSLVAKKFAGQNFADPNAIAKARPVFERMGRVLVVAVSPKGKVVVSRFGHWMVDDDFPGIVFSNDYMFPHASRFSKTTASSDSVWAKARREADITPFRRIFTAPIQKAAGCLTFCNGGPAAQAALAFAPAPKPGDRARCGQCARITDGPSPELGICKAHNGLGEVVMRSAFVCSGKFKWNGVRS
jgi:hypothetical protein